MKTFIPHIKIIIFSVVCVLLSSCNRINNSNGFVYDDSFWDNEPLPPTLQCDLPIFPFEVLYVVSKEYELFESGQSAKTTYKGVPMSAYTKAEYMELRLIDLFPTKAYTGMIAESQSFYEHACSLYNSYLDEDYAWAMARNDSTIVWNETHQYVSDDDEILFMQMTETEVNAMDAYNQIAQSAQLASLNDICSAIETQTNLKAASSGVVVFGCVAVALGSYVYLRALNCANRTYDKVEFYYGVSNTGEVSDAFKHISVSMLLRRYLSQPMSYLIMDLFYENNHPTPINRSTMDLHNNRVGRSTEYSRFRGAFFADMYKWELWISRVKAFVDDSNNGVFVNWDDSTDASIVKADEQSVDKGKYIFFKY